MLPGGEQSVPAEVEAHVAEASEDDVFLRAGDEAGEPALAPAHVEVVVVLQQGHSQLHLPEHLDTGVEEVPGEAKPDPGGVVLKLDGLLVERGVQAETAVQAEAFEELPVLLRQERVAHGDGIDDRRGIWRRFVLLLSSQRPRRREQRRESAHHAHCGRPCA